MARATVKATYSLDPETVRLLERSARRWGVSKSEALRRAIRASAARSAGTDERLVLLERLQDATAITPAAAGAWSRRVRSERRRARTRTRSRE